MFCVIQKPEDLHYIFEKTDSFHAVHVLIIRLAIRATNLTTDRPPYLVSRRRPSLFLNEKEVYNPSPTI